MTHPTAREVNFDGLIGASHNYAGLSPGNVASASNAGQTARPRAAALQGLAKMKALMDLGLTQGVLPPHARPDLGFLRSIGFTGDDARVLKDAHDADPSILAAAWSASAMWSANAATVSPSADTADRKVHITPANLVSNLHRSFEHHTTSRALRAIFRDPDRFVVHDTLPSQPRFADEGAANHIRFTTAHAEPGVELFVYGVDNNDPMTASRRFPARQTRSACEALVRSHKLDPAKVILARQHPDAIDSGVFHNDVIATGNENVFLYHEQSFATSRTLMNDLMDPSKSNMVVIEARETDFSIEDAVTSYIFNSQIVTLAPGDMRLIAPCEVRENPRVRAFVDRIIQDPFNPVNGVIYMDVRESMNNGGGPACLRLRVVLTDDELASIHQGVILTDDLYERLVACVNETYPESIAPGDLTDPELAARCVHATERIASILGLESIFAHDPLETLA